MLKENSLGEIREMEADFGSSRKAEIEEHVTIDMIPEGSLVLSIKEKMEKVSNLGTICRVPDEFLKGNEGKYHPSLVSIGPLHYGKDTQTVKDLKWQYLNAILARKPGLEETLDACVKTLKNLEQKARRCYAEDLDLIGSNEFVQMMLLDGFFIIELFLKYAFKNLKRRDDPFFTKEKFLRFRCDLILLENQIPFFVLQQLFHLVQIPEQFNQSLIELSLRFFRKWIPGYVQYPPEKFGPDVHHLLDLVRQCHLPAIPEVHSSSMQKSLLATTELKAQGIRIYDATAGTLLNIKFHDGILEIPPLEVHLYTEILFKNLLALESCSRASPKHVTSYIFLVKQLIKAEEDVRILKRRQILISDSEKLEEILPLFASFKDLDMKAEDFYYRWLCEKITEHARIKEQKKWSKRIKHLYAKTPYGVAGFSFAILVVVSIFTAALFIALQFFLHHFSN